MKPILEIPGYRLAHKLALRFGPDGVTAWEAHKASGVPLSTIQNRLRELVRKGHLRLGEPTADKSRMGDNKRDMVDTFVGVV